MRSCDLFVTRAFRVRGSVAENGMALLRPDYVVFAPDAPDAPNATAHGYAGKMLPQAFSSLAAYVEYLSTLPEPEFDQTIREAADRCGWSRVALDGVKVVRKKPLFRRHRLFVSIEGKTESIRFDGPVHQVRMPDVEAMLSRHAP